MTRCTGNGPSGSLAPDHGRKKNVGANPITTGRNRTTAMMRKNRLRRDTGAATDAATVVFAIDVDTPTSRTSQRPLSTDVVAVRGILSFPFPLCTELIRVDNDQPRERGGVASSLRGPAMRFWLLLLLVAAPTLRGQTPTADQKRPAFEVATIKRNISGEGGSIGIEPGGRFRAINADVRFMIAAMYRPAGGRASFNRRS